MTKRERVEAVYRLKKADRIPFVPAIYEHKGHLVGRSPSEICRNPEYLYAGLQRELQLYDPDMLVIGIDVYNIEAEAAGCEVTYFEQSNDVPVIAKPLVTDAAGLDRLRAPDPARDGRMPLYLEVAAALASEHAGDMVLRGAVTGPYSMAAAMAGCERFALATVEEPEFAMRLMRFCAGITVEFGKAFLARNVEPIVFDSQATPQLASPRVVREMLLPLYRDYVFPELRSAGGRLMPLIIGGNTDSIIADLVSCGASQFLCDRPASLAKYKECCGQAHLPFRANVDARLVHSGPPAAIRRQALQILRECQLHPGFLLGCGVVAYDADPSHVIAIRQAIEDVAAGAVDFERELASQPGETQY
jgi:uroporphyrinogen decarboxylase